MVQYALQQIVYQNKIELDYCINLYGLSEHHFTNDINYA